MLFLQYLSAFFIILNLFIFVMLTSIQFNTKFCFVTVEIKDKTCLGMLSAEFCIVESTVAENLPHELFGFSGVLAKFTDAFFEFFGEAWVVFDWLALTPALSRGERG